MVAELHQTLRENSCCPKAWSNSSSAVAFMLARLGKRIISLWLGQGLLKHPENSRPISLHSPHGEALARGQAGALLAGALCTGTQLSPLPEVLHTWVAAAAAGPGQRALSELSTVHAVCGVTLLGAPSADPRGSFGGCKSSLSWTLLPWHCPAAVA